MLNAERGSTRFCRRLPTGSMRAMDRAAFVAQAVRIRDPAFTAWVGGMAGRGLGGERYDAISTMAPTAARIPTAWIGPIRSRSTPAASRIVTTG